MFVIIKIYFYGMMDVGFLLIYKLILDKLKCLKLKGLLR